MRPEIAIELRGVTKHFRKRTLRPAFTTLKSELIRLLRADRRRAERDLIPVLRGVDLEIPAGQTFGIVGRNGSGKSTILKLITGIYAPSAGTVQVNGRISALLELGAGFHPDFSGRENILINGRIMGMSAREIRERTPEIIRFSELEEFIDQPIRTYSSGMFLRLAFSVATHVNPDILIVDEILAVGDDHFARKSLNKMLEFKAQRKTIVLVTHDLGTVERWCDAAVWIEGGVVRRQGAPKDVADAYRRTIAEEEMRQQAALPAAPPPLPAPPVPEQASAPGDPAPPAAPAPVPPAPEWPEPRTGPRGLSRDLRYGTYQVEMARVRVLDSAGQECALFDPEDGLILEIEFETTEQVDDVIFGVAIYAADGQRVYGTNTQVEQVPLPRPLPPSGRLRLEIARVGLTEGDYWLDLAAHSKVNTPYDWQKGLNRFAVRSSAREVGIYRPPHRWTVDCPARPIDLTSTGR